MAKVVVYKGRCADCSNKPCISMCGTSNLRYNKEKKIVEPIVGVASQELADRIEYDVPGCAACRYCEVYCPTQSIKIVVS